MDYILNTLMGGTKLSFISPNSSSDSSDSTVASLFSFNIGSYSMRLFLSFSLIIKEMFLKISSIILEY